MNSVCSQQRFYYNYEDEDIYSFLLSNDSEDLTIDNQFYLQELFKFEPLALKAQWGIFRILSTVTHSFNHYMLVKDGTRTYINGYQETDAVLLPVVEFLDESSCSVKEKMEYLRRIIRLRCFDMRNEKTRYELNDGHLL